ncbi:hypothetical protein Cyast_2712 [Cyanobacterium stanieri PCC 7202]|uniref:DUF5615 domain-containing protein n=1 Tax=Cyanobacterium stanieri (strain ATCC 29140 / PCC 7202) TaxID=292563 RepID=K9YQI8_CYASC|nr:hypothetical protein Cyast_2712 [Cyanobacterium stanieri PCC 7202]
MNFYANENLPLVIVNGLRELNHDVLTSYEAGNANQGIPDDLDKARYFYIKQHTTIESKQYCS